MTLPTRSPPRPAFAAAVLPALLLAACASTPRTADLSRTIIIPAGAEAAYDQYHYAPAVRVGDTVIVSGIPAPRGDTYEERIDRMFQRLQGVLEASGATLADVVEIQTFHAHVTDTPSFEAEFERFRTVHARYFKDGYPAWTAVGTTALLAEGSPVEMRVVAVVGAGKQTRIQRGRP